jgi:hypothetical protein
MFVVKIYDLDCSSYKVNSVGVKTFNTLDESRKFIIEEYYKIAFDNEDTDLSLEEFLNENSLEDIKDKLYDTFDYEIIKE